ncbi:Uncharacterised protein [Mycobacteroides abscessus subsp. abscessus]|nr:Uncharacterised protein [Mycobacteroides abscessus subsp. abscessus]
MPAITLVAASIALDIGALAGGLMHTTPSAQRRTMRRESPSNVSYHSWLR